MHKKKILFSVFNLKTKKNLRGDATPTISGIIKDKGPIQKTLTKYLSSL